MDPRLELILLLTDKIFLAIQRMQEVTKMSKVEALKEIEKERAEKDNLVEEVTL